MARAEISQAVEGLVSKQLRLEHHALLKKCEETSAHNEEVRMQDNVIRAKQQKEIDELKHRSNKLEVLLNEYAARQKKLEGWQDRVEEAQMQNDNFFLSGIMGDEMKQMAAQRISERETGNPTIRKEPWKPHDPRNALTENDFMDSYTSHVHHGSTREHRRDWSPEPDNVSPPSSNLQHKNPSKKPVCGEAEGIDDSSGDGNHNDDDDDDLGASMHIGNRVERHVVKTRYPTVGILPAQQGLSKKHLKTRMKSADPRPTVHSESEKRNVHLWRNLAQREQSQGYAKSNFKKTTAVVDKRNSGQHPSKIVVFPVNPQSKDLMKKCPNYMISSRAELSSTSTTRSEHETHRIRRQADGFDDPKRAKKARLTISETTCDHPPSDPNIVSDSAAKVSVIPETQYQITMTQPGVAGLPRLTQGRQKFRTYYKAACEAFTVYDDKTPNGQEIFVNHFLNGIHTKSQRHTATEKLQRLQESTVKNGKPWIVCQWRDVLDALISAELLTMDEVV